MALIPCTDFRLELPACEVLWLVALLIFWEENMVPNLDPMLPDSRVLRLVGSAKKSCSITSLIVILSKWFLFRHFLMRSTNKGFRSIGNRTSLFLTALRMCLMVFGVSLLYFQRHSLPRMARFRSLSCTESLQGPKYRRPSSRGTHSRLRERYTVVCPSGCWNP